MLTEKMAALTEVQLAAAAAVRPRNSHTVAAKVLRVYKKESAGEQELALEAPQIFVNGLTRVLHGAQLQFSLPLIDFCFARFLPFSPAQTTAVSKLPPPRTRRHPGRRGAHPMRPSHTI